MPQWERVHTPGTAAGLGAPVGRGKTKESLLLEHVGQQQEQEQQQQEQQEEEQEEEEQQEQQEQQQQQEEQQVRIDSAACYGSCFTCTACTRRMS